VILYSEGQCFCLLQCFDIDGGQQKVHVVHENLCRLLGMRRSSNPNLNVVGFQQFFANPKSDGFQTRLRWIWIQLSFWKAFFHHSSQSAISHAAVNKQLCME